MSCATISSTKFFPHLLLLLLWSMSNFIASLWLWCPYITWKTSEKNIKILKNLQKRFLRRNEKSKERFIYLYSFFFISAQWFFDENCENNPVPRKSDKSETSSSKLRTRLAETLVSVSKKEKEKKWMKKKMGRWISWNEWTKSKNEGEESFSKGFILFSILHPIACSPSPDPRYFSAMTT